MKNILIFISAFFVTSLVMMIFEYTNHLMYPFPDGLDTSNLQAIQEFGKTMPTFAFVMILFGWFFGTILGVGVLQKYLKTIILENKTKIIYCFSGLLTALAIGNNFMYVGFGNRMWFEMITLPFFFVVAYFSLKYIK